MRIAVVGCGALGGFYGAKLCRAGEDVTFLLRSDYEVVRRKGVFIQSNAGDFNVRPGCARAPEEIGQRDVVLIGLKTTANDQFERLLPPLVGPGTAIVTLQNGLGNEEQLARLFPAEQILGGLCFVCLNRVAPGVIQHLDHGRVVLGEFGRWPEPRTHTLAELFRKAGVPCEVTDNLARSHWEKLVWNIPFNGLGVASAAGYDAVLEGGTQPAANAKLPPASPANPDDERLREVTLTPTHGMENCLTTDRLLGDARWEQLVRELMGEVIVTANALGFPVSESLSEKNIRRTQTMGAYKASTLIDFERGRPLELEALFLEPLRQARKAGVRTPRLAALCEVLKQLAARQAVASTKETGAGQTVPAPTQVTH